MGNLHTCGPNEVMVISGGCLQSTKRYVSGSWAWTWWCLNDIQRLNLEVITLNPSCQEVETAEGVPISVSAVAQVKVFTEPGIMELACEQFLGQPISYIKKVLESTLDGHLRAILATMTMEAIYQDRVKFATLVREVAAPDLAKMGFEILSFALQDIFDFVDYLNSIGKGITAEMKKNAAIGVAEADRDAEIKISHGQRIAMGVKYEVDTRIANFAREFEMQQTQFEIEVKSLLPISELAYEFQAAKEEQKIRKEEIQIDIVERRKEISIQEKEVERVEKELTGTIKLPADALAFQLQTIAEGQKTKTIKEALADAEKTKLLGQAQAVAINCVGKAEAKRMKMKAEAFRKYGEAAVAQLVWSSMPSIAAEVVAPLEKVGEIVVIGESCEKSPAPIGKYFDSFLLDNNEKFLTTSKSKPKKKSKKNQDFRAYNLDKA